MRPPFGIFVKAHLGLIIATAMIFSAALVAAKFNGLKGDQLFLVSTAMGAFAAPALGSIWYVITLRLLLQRAGFVASVKRVAVLGGAAAASYGMFFIIVAGSADAAEPDGFVAGMIIGAICAWIGSLLAQLGIASLLTWDQSSQAGSSVADQPWYVTRR